jgi:hypothetical protein
LSSKRKFLNFSSLIDLMPGAYQSALGILLTCGISGHNRVDVEVYIAGIQLIKPSPHQIFLRFD